VYGQKERQEEKDVLQQRVEGKRCTGAKTVVSTKISQAAEGLGHLAIITCTARLRKTRLI
jgi:hypothetical protein